MTTSLKTDRLVAGMAPVLQPGLFVFCSVLHHADNREALAQAHGMQVEDEGLSLILPRAEAHRLGLTYELPMRQISLMANVPLGGVALTAAVAAALTHMDVPAYVAAASMHIHLYVPSDLADEALDTLRSLQRDARERLAA